MSTRPSLTRYRRWARVASWLAGSLMALGMSGVALAQGFPTRPVTIVVPYTPGGVTDLYARAVAASLQQKWGQPVLVENKAGAGTVIGTQFASRAPADGHTILLTSYAFTSNQVLLKSLPYDTASLKPLVLMGNSVNMLVVNNTLPAIDLKAVIARAKSKPGALTLASSGNGSSPHIAAMLFANQIGADVTHVPYKGTAPAMTDVIGGQVDGIFDGISSMVNVRAGKTRAIAVAAAQRHPLAQDIPTFRELGLDFTTGSWFGFFVPAATPADVQKRLYADLRATLDEPATREQIAKGGLLLSHATPEEFGKFLDTELQRLKKLVAASPDKFTID